MTSGRLGRALFLISLMTLGVTVPAHAQSNVACPSVLPSAAGTPGAAGGQVVDTYYAPIIAGTMAAGSVNFAPGAARGAAHTLAVGDVLLIIQMQGAAYNSTNTSAFGDGTTKGSGYTTGATAIAGGYEFVTITAVNTVFGFTFYTIAGAGTGGGTVHAYVSAAPTATQGAETYQTVWFPRYASVTLSGDITALPWDGTTGGLVVLDSKGTLNLNGHNITVNGKGFRGGLAIRSSGTNAFANTDFVQTSPTANSPTPVATAHASKGEGIAGGPRFTRDGSLIIANAGSDLYVNSAGGYAMGAPGNAGGGGTDANPAVNDQNTGGGGGGNGGAGGKGGFNWTPTIGTPSTVHDTGGRGGASFSVDAASYQIIMGGGGGAATTKGGTGSAPNGIAGESSSGAAGGGIILLRANDFSGTGTVSANGASADNSVLSDGSGGGGAGGTVVLQSRAAANSATAAVTANGGVGGANTGGGAPHGPGGGGGGGFIYQTAGAGTAAASGGSQGSTAVAGIYDLHYGATAGTAGKTTTSSTLNAGITGIRSSADCANSTTSVDMGRIDAQWTPEGVVLRWRTRSEQDNVGFLIYRTDAGARTLVTPDLLAGSALRGGALLKAGYAYAWKDAAGRPTSRYDVVDVDLAGRQTVHGPLTPRVLGAPLFLNTLAAPLLSQASRMHTAPIPWTAKRVSARGAGSPAPPSATEAVTQAALASAGAIKLGIRQEGLYRVTSVQLAQAGWDVSAVSLGRLRLYVEAHPVPFEVTQLPAGGWAVEFYATGLDTQSSDTRVYWLDKEGGRSGAALDHAAFVPGAPLTRALSTVERVERTLYFPGLQNGGESKFFGAFIGSHGATQTLTVAHPDSSGGPALLVVSLQGATLVSHQVHVALNGLELGVAQFADQQLHDEALTVPSALLRAGDNTVTLWRDGNLADVSLLAGLKLSYPRLLVADADALQVEVPPGSHTLTLTGFSGTDVRVLDITLPDRPVLLRAGRAHEGAGVTVGLTSTATQRLLAVGSNGVLTPDSIELDTASRLANRVRSAGMLAIGPRAFLDAAEPLLERRESQGIRVARVDIQDAYDELSFGEKDPAAIFRLVQLAARPHGPLRFVLLVGDASADPRNYLGLGFNDVVPTQLVDTNYYQASSDDPFVDLNHDGLPDLAVGRLPARSVSEVSAMVAKIAAYEDGGPKHGALLVADAPDSTADFEQATRALLPLLPPGVLPTVVRRAALGDSAARVQVLSAAGKGPGLVNFNGHGSVDLWHADILTSDDAALLPNVASPSVFLLFTCLNAAFHIPELDSLGEALLKAPGGAVAVLGSSSIVPVDSQSALDQAVVRELYRSSDVTLGEAVMRAKAQVPSALLQTWVLLGDPSLRVQTP